MRNNTDASPSKISFLATGNEIIEGEYTDTNGRYFAELLHEHGARIYQHVHVSDHKEDICDALKYLLAHSGAVIITGGLGPTSDDNTRFAVADVMGEDLVFNEIAWHAIEERFKKYSLRLTESNRQQALFPKNATLYQNPNGSAAACHITFQGKHIFMLPGPPRECLPIFNEHVVQALESLSFYDKKETFRWLTMGLSEGEIAEKVDAIAKTRGFQTGYRWSYPYLEIKVHAQEKAYERAVIDDVDALLAEYCVSTERKDAITVLGASLLNVDEPICIHDDITENDADRICHEKILYIHSDEMNVPIFFKITASEKLTGEAQAMTSIVLSCHGYRHGALQYEHTMRVPRRGAEILHFVKHYLAWQLTRFVSQGLS